jgi:hypothetical protein
MTSILNVCKAFFFRYVFVVVFSISLTHISFVVIIFEIKINNLLKQTKGKIKPVRSFSQISIDI